ncbi:MAG: peptide/nickel transport system substrate-binding protein [Thermomicrobiales bacterium]|nr:peptide/nickel transport system substrate-binding protein [Thermomicrobiales bacterium]
MSQEEFAKILLDGKISRREAIRRLTALGLSAPVAATIAARVVPASAAPRHLVTRTTLNQEAAGDGTLIVGTETEIEGFDPARGIALATNRVQSAIFEGMVKYQPGTVDLIPLLATEIPTQENGGISADGLSYTFKLRPGVKFSDGTDFNADAVLFSLRRLIDKEFEFYDAANTGGFQLAGLTKVDVIDPMTVKFTLAAPNAAFIELSQIGSGRFVSPKAIQEHPGDALSEGGVGTGPFMVKSWEKNAKVELERNENYWGTKPALKTLIFRPIPESTARVSALLNGEVDMIVVVQPDAIESIKADANLTYEQGPSNHYWFIELYTKEGPFADKRVRQAANYAVDKEGLANDVLAGSAVPATQPMPAANWSYNPNVVGYPYDLEKAKTLLTEAGFPDGFKTKMIIPTNGSGMMVPVQMNEYIQGNLAEAGIEVEIQSFEWVSYLGVWAAGLTAETGVANQSVMSSEPYFVNFLLTSQFIPANGGFNIGYYANPDVDKLLNDALATPDREARKQLYWQAWEKIVDDAPWIFVVNDLQPMAFQKKVKGYLTNPAYLIDFTTITIEE